MTVLIHPNIRNLMIYNGLYLGGLDSFLSGAPPAVSVYGGAQPTAAQITANFSAYNSASPDFLGHFRGGSWTVPSYGILLQLSTIPPASNAANNGTGSWCIIWAADVTLTTMALTALPTTRFIVGPVSDGIGQGVIRFSNTTFVSGAPKTILDGSFGASVY